MITVNLYFPLHWPWQPTQYFVIFIMLSSHSYLWTKENIAASESHSAREMGRASQVMTTKSKDPWGLYWEARWSGRDVLSPMSLGLLCWPGRFLLLVPASATSLGDTACLPSLFFYCILFYFWLFQVACRILVPQPGIEPGVPAVRVPSPNHWTAGEFPCLPSLWVNIVPCGPLGFLLILLTALEGSPRNYQGLWKRHWKINLGHVCKVTCLSAGCVCVSAVGPLTLGPLPSGWKAPPQTVELVGTGTSLGARQPLQRHNLIILSGWGPAFTKSSTSLLRTMPGNSAARPPGPYATWGSGFGLHTDSWLVSSSVKRATLHDYWGSIEIGRRDLPFTLPALIFLSLDLCIWIWNSWSRGQHIESEDGSLPRPTVNEINTVQKHTMSLSFNF